MFYLDTSAAVKLVVAEPGSTALRRWLEARDGLIFSSDLLRTELLRAVRRVAPDQMLQARVVIETLVIVKSTSEVCERAAMLDPGIMRSLDAVHLAAALEIGDELEGVVTYDERMATAAATLGIGVMAPR